MYNPVVTVDGYDFNHRNEAERARWIDASRCARRQDHADHHRAAAAIRACRPMTFYGYNPALQTRPGRGAAEAVRHPPRRPQLVAVERGVHASCCRRSSRSATRSAGSGSSACGGTRLRPRARPRARKRRSGRIPRAFRRLRIETPKAVLYHDVIRTMSTARINIFTQRPVLRHLKHLTLKYFEIFCADTIPLLMLDADHAEAVYGPAGRELSLPGAVAEQAARCPAPSRSLPRMSSRTSAAISSRTTPTTGASRSLSPRCGAERP